MFLGGMTVHSGQIPKAKILVENRMGNKAVTILRGLEVFAIDLAVLTKECQKKYVYCCNFGQFMNLHRCIYMSSISLLLELSASCEDV